MSNKIIRLANEIRRNVNTRFDVALLTIIETLSDCQDDTYRTTIGENLSVDVNDHIIDIIWNTTGEVIFTLEAHYED
jgi:hypothetical protein